MFVVGEVTLAQEGMCLLWGLSYGDERVARKVVGKMERRRYLPGWGLF